MKKFLSCLLSFTIIFMSITPSLAQIRGGGVARAGGRVARVGSEAARGVERATKGTAEAAKNSAKPAGNAGRSGSRVTEGSGRSGNATHGNGGAGGSAASRGNNKGGRGANQGTSNIDRSTNRGSSNARGSGRRGGVDNNSISRNRAERIEQSATRTYQAANNQGQHATKILEITEPAQRAKELRTTFPRLVVTKRASATEVSQAVEIYRTQLEGIDFGQFPEVLEPASGEVAELAGAAADISSLGLMGTAEHDAAFILEVYQKSVGTAAEPAITISAARALLRLEAYEELSTMSEMSSLHPELWEGISTYAKAKDLPLTIMQRERTPVSMEALQGSMEELGYLNELVTRVDENATSTYMNVGRDLNRDRGLAEQPALPAKPVTNGSSTLQAANELPPGFEIIDEAAERQKDPLYTSAGAPAPHTGKVQPVVQTPPIQTPEPLVVEQAPVTPREPAWVETTTRNPVTGEIVTTYREVNPEASAVPTGKKSRVWDQVVATVSTRMAEIELLVRSKYGWLGLGMGGSPLMAEAAVHEAPVAIVQEVRAAERGFVTIEELNGGPGASARVGSVNAGGMAAQRAADRTFAAARKLKSRSSSETGVGTKATSGTRPVTMGSSRGRAGSPKLKASSKTWFGRRANGTRRSARKNERSANQAARVTLSQQYPLVSALKNVVMSEADNKYREQALLRLYDQGALSNIIDALPQETRQKIQTLADGNKRNELGALLLSLYQMGIISSGVNELVDNIAVQSLLEEVGAIVNTPEFRAEAMARFNQQERLSAAEGSFEGDVPLPSETDIEEIASTFRDKDGFVVPEGEDLGDVIFYAQNVPFYYRNSRGELSPEPVGVLSQEKANKLNNFLSKIPYKLFADKPGFYLAKGFVLALDEQGQWKLMVQPGKLSVVESIPSSRKILDEIQREGSKHVAVDTPYTTDQLLAMAKVLDNNPDRRLQLTLNAPSSFRQFLIWFGAYIGMDSANSLTGPYKKTMSATAELGWPAVGITNFISGFGYVSPWIGAWALPLMKKIGYAKSILGLFAIAGITLTLSFLGGMDGWSVFPDMVKKFQADPSNTELLLSLMGQLAGPLAVMVITGSLFGSLIPIILNIYKDPTARTAANLQFATTKQWSRLGLTGITAAIGIDALGGDWTIVIPLALALVIGSALLFFNTPIIKNSQREKAKEEEDKRKQEEQWRAAGLDPEVMRRQQKEQEEAEAEEFKAAYSEMFRHLPEVEGMVTRVRGVYWAYAASLMMIGQIVNELLGNSIGQWVTAAFMLFTVFMRTYAKKAVENKTRTDDQLTGMSIPLLAVSAALLTVLPYQVAWIGVLTALVAAAHYVGTAVPGQLDNTRMQNMVSALIQEEKQAVLNDPNLTKAQQDEALEKLKRKEKDWASRASASYSYANGWGEGGVLIAAILGFLFIDQAPDWVQSILSAIRDSLGAMTSWITSMDLYGDETNTLTMQRLVFLMSTGVLSYLTIKNWGLTQEFFRSFKTTQVTAENIKEGKVSASTFGITAKNAKQNLSKIGKELDKLKEKMVVFGVISEKKMTDLYSQLTIAYNRLVAVREKEGMTPTVKAEFDKLYKLANTYMTLLTKHKMSTMLEREFQRFINDISVDGLLSELPENPRYVPEGQYTTPQGYEKFEEAKMLVREMNNLAGQIRDGQGVQVTTYQLFIDYYNRVRDNLVDYSKLNVADSNRVLVMEQELMKICQELKKADAMSDILVTNKGPVSMQDVQALRDMLDGIPDEFPTNGY